MRRVIDRSIAEGIISGSSSGKGRARVLKVTDAFLERVKVQLETQVAKVDTSSGQIVTQCGHFVTASGQSGHLSKLISIPLSKSKDPNNALEYYKALDKSEVKPKAPDVEEEARKKREKAEYLELKKSLLSKAQVEQVDYSDVPE
jgi:hypothetical protein